MHGRKVIDIELHVIYRSLYPTDKLAVGRIIAGNSQRHFESAKDGFHFHAFRHHKEHIVAQCGDLFALDDGNTTIIALDTGGRTGFCAGGGNIVHDHGVDMAGSGDLFALADGFAAVLTDGVAGVAGLGTGGVLLVNHLGIGVLASGLFGLGGAAICGNELTPIVAVSIRGSIAAEVVVSRSGLATKGAGVFIVSHDQGIQGCIPLINGGGGSIGGEACTCGLIVHIDIGLGGAISGVQQISAFHSFNINQNRVCLIGRTIIATTGHSTNVPQGAVGIVGSNLISSTDNQAIRGFAGVGIGIRIGVRIGIGIRSRIGGFTAAGLVGIDGAGGVGVNSEAVCTGLCRQAGISIAINGACKGNGHDAIFFRYRSVGNILPALYIVGSKAGAVDLDLGHAGIFDDHFTVLIEAAGIGIIANIGGRTSLVVGDSNTILLPNLLALGVLGAVCLITIKDDGNRGLGLVAHGANTVNIVVLAGGRNLLLRNDGLAAVGTLTAVGQACLAAGGGITGQLFGIGMFTIRGSQLEGVDFSIAFFKTIGAEATHVVFQILIVIAVVIGTDAAQVNAIVALGDFPTTAIGEGIGQREAAAGGAGGHILAIHGEGAITVLVLFHVPNNRIGRGGKLAIILRCGNIDISGRIVDQNGAACRLGLAASGASAILIVMGQHVLIVGLVAEATAFGLTGVGGVALGGAGRSGHHTGIEVVVVALIFSLSGGSIHFGNILTKEQEGQFGIVNENITGTGDGLDRVITAQFPSINGVFFHPPQQDIQAFDNAVATPHGAGITPTDIDIQHNTGNVAMQVMLATGFGVGIVERGTFAISLVSAGRIHLGRGRTEHHDIVFTLTRSITLTIGPSVFTVPGIAGVPVRTKGLAGIEARNRLAILTAVLTVGVLILISGFVIAGDVAMIALHQILQGFVQSAAGCIRSACAASQLGQIGISNVVVLIEFLRIGRKEGCGFFTGAPVVDVFTAVNIVNGRCIRTEIQSGQHADAHDDGHEQRQAAFYGLVHKTITPFFIVQPPQTPSPLFPFYDPKKQGIVWKKPCGNCHFCCAKGTHKLTLIILQNLPANNWDNTQKTPSFFGVGGGLCQRKKYSHAKSRTMSAAMR